MGQATQLATLRQELRAVFPSSIPSWNPSGGWMRSGVRAGLSTGQRTLDQLLNGQGLPRGRITEVTGGPSSGRTTLLLSAVAETTRAGMPVAWVDPARSFHPPAAWGAGVLLERLLLVQPTGLAEVFRAADILLRGQAFSLVVIDLGSELVGQDPPSATGSTTGISSGISSGISTGTAAGSTTGSGTGIATGTALARLNGLCALGETALVFLTGPTTSQDALRYYASIRLETCREDAVAARAPSPAPVLHALGGGGGRQASTDPAPGLSRAPGRPILSVLSGLGAASPSDDARASVVENPGRASPDSDRGGQEKARQGVSRPRLVGRPIGAAQARLRVQMLKNKLGPPGGSCEVALDGGDAHRLPLHPGLPDSSPST